MRIITQEELNEIIEAHDYFLQTRSWVGAHEVWEAGERADLSDCDLRNDLEFDEFNLDEVSFKGSLLEGCKIIRGSLVDAQFSGVDLSGVVFFDCNLEGSNFMDCNCAHASFKICNLKNSYFFRANLFDVDFELADLRGANLQNVVLNWQTDPIKFLNCDYQGIEKNELAKRWIRDQAFIADLLFKVRSMNYEIMESVIQNLDVSDNFRANIFDKLEKFSKFRRRV